MHYPKMIFFDYGQTLLHEFYFDIEQGLAAIMPLLDLPADFDVKEVKEGYLQYHKDIFEKAVRKHVEIPFGVILDYVLQLYGAKRKGDIAELEFLLWEAACPCETMPKLRETLAALHECGVRTAVISNIAFTKEALRLRIEKHVSPRDFEFYVASSECGLRKPEPWIFRRALQESDLAAAECWYVGDDIHCDIYGADIVGMQPVLYESKRDCFYKREEVKLGDDLAAVVPVIEQLDELVDLVDRARI